MWPAWNVSQLINVDNSLHVEWKRTSIFGHNIEFLSTDKEMHWIFYYNFAGFLVPVVLKIFLKLSFINFLLWPCGGTDNKAISLFAYRPIRYALTYRIVWRCWRKKMNDACSKLRWVCTDVLHMLHNQDNSISYLALMIAQAIYPPSYDSICPHHWRLRTFL